jgi:CubicO group peptidase (beta-lactamase class C family)
MISSCNRIINEAIQREIFPGCVIGIVTSAGERTVLPFGALRYDQDSPAVKECTIFDVASITKSIPTSTLALMALERELVTLHTPVIGLIPELQYRYREQITFAHLLTHTVDFRIQLSRYKDLPPEEILKNLYSAEIGRPPGTSFLYCNATSILLGLCVERLFKAQLDLCAEQYLFEPLGMYRTSFFPPDYLINDIAPTEIDSWRHGAIQGETHDESAWKLKKLMVPGSAGLFSTVPDLLNFLEMILGRGTRDGQFFLNPDTIERMSVNQIGEIHECTGLGWELHQRRYMGFASSKRTIGKTGFTGCVVMCDLEKGIGLVMLSNYTWPSRKKNSDVINAVRSAVADVVFAEPHLYGAIL